MSSLHNSGDIDEDSGLRKSPEITTFYNLTKGAVDVVDELKGAYSVSQETRRWPIVIFYALLNMGGINSQIIYRENTGNKLTRRSYLNQLGKDLIIPFFKVRVAEPSLSLELRSLIKRSGKIKVEEVVNKTQGFCNYCPRRSNKKTKKQCATCSQFIYPSHTLLRGDEWSV